MNYTNKNRINENNKLKEKLHIIEKDFKEVEGFLIDYSTITSGEADFYSGIYEYYINGKRYVYDKVLLEENQGCKRNVRNKITLLYNPQNPQEAYSEYSINNCEDFNPLRDNLAIFIGLILLLLLFSGLLLALHFFIK